MDTTVVQFFIKTIYNNHLMEWSKRAHWPHCGGYCFSFCCRRCCCHLFYFSACLLTFMFFFVYVLRWLLSRFRPYQFSTNTSKLANWKLNLIIFNRCVETHGLTPGSMLWLKIPSCEINFMLCCPWSTRTQDYCILFFLSNGPFIFWATFLWFIWD